MFYVDDVVVAITTTSAIAALCWVWGRGDFSKLTVLCLSLDNNDIIAGRTIVDNWYLGTYVSITERCYIAVIKALRVQIPDCWLGSCP